jgi:prephenate dehydrogenase
VSLISGSAFNAQLALESASSNPETPAVHWKQVTLVGVGLLGGSLGLALRKRRLADCVTGFVRRSAGIVECEKAGAVDRATQDLGLAVSEADLVVLCTPIAQMRSLTKEMLPFLRPGAIVTDVGSVKQSVARELTSLVSKAGGYFVGSHPMAGSEKTGVGAARDDLFVEAICVVTPDPQTNANAVRKVTGLWKSVGARVIQLTPQLHDKLVSRSSHLPHVIAAQLSNLVLNPKSPKHQAILCANGFRDTTRIASGSPEMWRDIALANRNNLLGALENFVAALTNFQRVLKRGDERAISRFFEQAKYRRDKWSGKTASHSSE